MYSRGVKLLFKGFLLIVDTLLSLIEIGASIYLSVIMWNIVKDFRIIGLTLTAYYILQIFVSLVLSSLSNRYGEPLKLIGISILTLALSYFILLLSYIRTLTSIMILAIIPFAIASALYIPNSRYTPKTRLRHGILFSYRIPDIVNRNSIPNHSFNNNS